MSIYAHVDPTTDQMTQLFWSLVPVVAEQASIPASDAIAHIRRAWMEGLRNVKISNAIDYRSDGRAAAWRVRLIIWRLDSLEQPSERIADTDPRAAFETYDLAPGETVIYGLPAVADWALELITSCHAGAAIDGISAPILASKVKSLRVALSNSGGKSVWRLRYAVTPPQAAAPAPPSGAMPRQLTPAPTLQQYIAYVYVQREEPARRHVA